MNAFTMLKYRYTMKLRLEIDIPFKLKTKLKWNKNTPDQIRTGVVGSKVRHD